MFWRVLCHHGCVTHWTKAWADRRRLRFPTTPALNTSSHQYIGGPSRQQGGPKMRGKVQQTEKIKTRQEYRHVTQKEGNSHIPEEGRQWDMGATKQEATWRCVRQALTQTCWKYYSLLMKCSSHKWLWFFLHFFGTEASLLIASTDSRSAVYNAANIAVNKLCGKLQGSCAQLRLKHCKAMTANVSDAAEIFMSVVPYRIQ